MAHTVVSGIFSSATYTADRGVAVPGLGFRFKLPYDFSDANATSLLNAIGARRKTAADKNLCPVAASDFKPRKITFVRRSGNSLSLVMPSLSNLLAQARAVRDAIDGIGGGDPVACALLSGEEWSDLVPELRSQTNFSATLGRSTAPATGGKQPIHSGKILYEFDGGTTTTPISVKVSTDAINATTGVTSPPSVLGGVWLTCVGPFEPKLPCSSSDSWKHRRYIVVSRVSDDPTAIGADGRYESVEVPHRGRTPASILSCGQALANLGSTICLKYRGESNGRFHVLI